ncbi:hypothetical protein BDW75DRAFT_40359 [Aspergillus navahoensis]
MDGKVLLEEIGPEAVLSSCVYLAFLASIVLALYCTPQIIACSVAKSVKLFEVLNLAMSGVSPPS